MAQSSNRGSDGSIRRGRLIFALSVAVVLAVATALLDLGFLANAIGAAHFHGSRGGQIAGFVIFFGIAIACTRWVIHLEHRLRAHTDVAKSYAHRHGTTFQSWNKPSAPAARESTSGMSRSSPESAAVSASAPQLFASGTDSSASASASTAAALEPSPSGAVAVTPRPAPVSRRIRRRRRKFGPTGTAIVGFLWVAGAVACVGGAVSSHAQADRSNYVQAHGIPVTATVANVDNTESCSKSSCSHTAAVTVTLPRPVGGTTTSIIHVPRYSVLYDGQPVAILVDPKQPSYSEIPGLKFKSPGEWIALACVAFALLILAALDFRNLARMLSHRRTHLAGSSPPTGTSKGPKTVY